jgi:hypothetical protein
MLIASYIYFCVVFIFVKHMRYIATIKKYHFNYKNEKMKKWCQFLVDFPM